MKRRNEGGRVSAVEVVGAGMGEHYPPIGGEHVADMRGTIAHSPPQLGASSNAWEE